MKIIEENKIALKAKNGDENSIIEIYNLIKKYYISWIVKNRFIKNDSDQNDFVQDLYFDLLKSLKNWDINKNASFRTFIAIQFPNIFFKSSEQKNEITYYNYKVNHYTKVGDENFNDLKSNEFADKKLEEKENKQILNNIFKQKKFTKQEIELVNLFLEGHNSASSKKIMNVTSQRISQLKNKIEKKLKINNLNSIL